MSVVPMQRLRLSNFADLALLNRLTTPIWVFNVNTQRMWWANDRAQAFWGADSLETLIARDFSADSATARARQRQIVSAANGTHKIEETWTLFPLGKPKTVFASIEPVVLQDKDDGILVELHRILETEQDQASWRILEAAQATSLIVSMFSLSGRLLAQNPAARACYGRSLPEEAGPGEVVANDIGARFRDPAVARHILDLVANDEELSWEVDVKTQLGFRTHLISARKGRDPITGAFTAILSEEDVTEMAALRRLQQNANDELRGAMAERSARLRVVEERFALAIETALVWDWDLASQEVYVSPGVIDALGYDAEAFYKAVRTAPLNAFFDPADHGAVRSEVERHLGPCQKTQSAQFRVRTASGAVRWFHAQGRCLFDDAGHPQRSLGLLTDITQQKELETTLLFSQRLEAIGQLTGGIAHDFNNLLSVILGNAELLEMTGTADRELLAEIVQAVNRGADLTSHMLAFARKQTLQPKSVDLDRLVCKMNNTLLRTLGEDVAVSLEIPDVLWWVYADPVQIEAALLNLAINARDAMPGGGDLKIRCQNQSFATSVVNGDHVVDPGDYVEIAFSDTGLGMHSETQAKAFEPFFTTKEVGKGSGLGLSMVLGFSRQSGGDTRIDSRLGQGTTVSILLPRAQAPGSSVAQIPTPVARLAQGRHVHVLEDNRHVQTMLVRMIESLGLTVTKSHDYASGLRAVESAAKPDLFLVDVVLPGGQSGYDFAETVHRECPKAKLILMSGHPHLDVAPVGDVHRSWPFLPKPIDKATLARAIANAFDEALEGQE